MPTLTCQTVCSGAPPDIVWSPSHVGSLPFGARFFSDGHLEGILCEVYHRVVGLSTHLLIAELLFQLINALTSRRHGRSFMLIRIEFLSPLPYPLLSVTMEEHQQVQKQYQPQITTGLISGPVRIRDRFILRPSMLMVRTTRSASLRRFMRY